MAAVVPVAAAVLAVGSLAMSAKQAKAQKQAGAMQQVIYDQRAAESRLKGRYEALEYKQRGVDALRRLNEVMAANVARAAAGGVDPVSGSAALINTVSEAEAISVGFKYGTSAKI